MPGLLRVGWLVVVLSAISRVRKREMFVLFCLSACVFLTKASAHKQRSRGDKEQRLTAIPSVFVLDEFQESRQPLKPT